MRHLGSIILALILAPVSYVLLALGEAKFGVGLVGFAVRSSSAALGTLVVAMLVLLVAGLLYALLLLLRLSPVGLVLAGLLLLGAQLWATFDLHGFTDLL